MTTFKQIVFFPFQYKSTGLSTLPEMSYIHHKIFSYLIQKPHSAPE